MMTSELHSKKIRRYNQSYKVEWELLPDLSSWISRSDKGEDRFFCKFCMIDLVSKSGITDVKRHLSSRKHKDNAIRRQNINDFNINEGLRNCTSVTPLDSDKKNKCYVIPYNPKWENIEPFSKWVSPSQYSKHYAFCKACKKDLVIGNNGKLSLAVHEKGKSHKRKVINMMNKLNTASENESVNVQIHDSNLGYECEEEVAIENSSLENNLIKGTNSMAFQVSPDLILNPLYPSWLDVSKLGKYFVHCKHCQVDINIRSLGLTAIRNHDKNMHENSDIDTILPVESRIQSSLPNKGELATQQEMGKKMVNFNDTTIDKKSKKQYFQCYSPRWENHPEYFSWLTHSPRGKYYAFCKACNVHLLIANGGKSDLKSHLKTRKHQNNFSKYYAFCKACNVHLLISNGGKSDLKSHLKTRKHQNNFSKFSSSTETIDPGESPPSEVVLECNWKSLNESIHCVLPKLKDVEVQRIVDHLVDVLGVETKEDLVHVKIDDFDQFLKPIQARKLVQAWQKDNSTHSNELNAPIKEENIKTLNEDPHESVTQFIECPLTEIQANTISSTNNIEESPESLNISLTNLSDNSIEPDPLNFVSIAQDKDLVISDISETPHKFENNDQLMLIKLWPYDFSVPVESFPPNLLSELYMNVKLSNNTLKDLIDIVADNIFQIVKTPSNEDLKIISRKLVGSFPCLKDEKEKEANVFIIFEKIASRINFLGQADLILSQKEEIKL